MHTLAVHVADQRLDLPAAAQIKRQCGVVVGAHHPQQLLHPKLVKGIVEQHPQEIRRRPARSIASHMDEGTHPGETIQHKPTEDLITTIF